MGGGGGHPLGGVGFAGVGGGIKHESNQFRIGPVELERNLDALLALEHLDGALPGTDGLLEDADALGADRLAGEQRLAIGFERPFVHPLALGHIFGHDDHVEFVAWLDFVREKRLADGAESGERAHIVRIEQSLLIGRDPDIHRAAVAHAREIQLHEIRRALGAAAFALVIEPAAPKRKVGLAGEKMAAVGLARIEQRAIIGSVGRYDGGARIAVQKSPLVARPAEIAILAATENGDVRLQGANEAHHLAEAIVVLADGAPLVGAAIPAIAPVGAVEPHFEHLAVAAAQEFLELGMEDLDVFFGGVVGAVAVPRRHVHAEFESRLAAGAFHFAHEVPLATAKRRLRDVEVGSLGGPETKAVVMLGHNDESPDTARLARRHYLVGIEPGRSELRGIFVAEAPFAVGVGVESEMDDADYLRTIFEPLFQRGTRHRARSPSNKGDGQRREQN